MNRFIISAWVSLAVLGCGPAKKKIQVIATDAPAAEAPAPVDTQPEQPAPPVTPVQPKQVPPKQEPAPVQPAPQPPQPKDDHAWLGCPVDQRVQEQARATSYYPRNSRMEGGFKDRKGAPLHTLGDYLDGNAPFVSVAMDSKVFVYGKRIRIPELEEQYHREIEFRVVDTGGAFRGKGMRRIDICVENYSASLDPATNRWLTLEFCDED